MKHRILKTVLAVLVICGSVGLAYWGGTATGNLLDIAKKDERMKLRQENTKAVLEQMGTVNAGSRIPDYSYFQDLDSRLVRLSDVIDRPTWLNFMQPGCDACLEEVETLLQRLSNGNSVPPIIVISNGNPLDLISLKNKYGLKCLILHDRNSTYWDAIGVAAYPFNIMVDSSLMVTKVIAGQLRESDIR